jgi:integrase
LFSPIEAEQERHLEAVSHRRIGQETTIALTNRKLGIAYSTQSYRKAIHRACKKAGVESWSPNQLRHTAATQIRAEFGLEAAQVILGHSKADVTQVYAERDMALAVKVISEVG